MSTPEIALTQGVPLSQLLGRGTVGQSENNGTFDGTVCGTVSLKSLANRVLQRSKVGQCLGQSVGQCPKKCPTGVEGVGQQNGAAPPLVPADFSTGLEWVIWPTDDAASDFDARWAAYDLADLCKLYGVRVVRAGKRVVAVYPPSLEPELVAYAGSLLAEAQDFLSANVDRLPTLPPDDAVGIILAVMREHPGLRFCRGDGGSLWPLYPKKWTAGQRATVQSLWLLAGDALDADSFMGVDSEQ